MVGKQLNKKLDELEEWFKENPKLPEEIDRILLRRFLKCMYNNVEDTKKIIEIHFSMRNKNPHIFIDRDPEDDAVKAIRDVVELTPLPDLTPEGHKLLLFRLDDKDPKKLNSNVECKTFFMLADCHFSDLDCEEPPPQNSKESKVGTETETRTETEAEAEAAAVDLIEDDSMEDNAIANGEVHVIDVTGYNLSHMARISLPTFRMYIHFLQEAYPVRLRAMHIINCPPFLNKMVAIFKPFINDDVFKMIHFHTEGMESFYEHVPRDLLPNEYGGKAGSIAELKQKWTDKLKFKRDYLMDPKQWKVEQSSRRRYWF